MNRESFDKQTSKADEIIEVWDWDLAVPLGIPISRAEAHKKGIAHEGVHLWVLQILNDEPELLFQRRALFKKSYPGYLDITVGGHVPFGLKDDKIQKEAMEEIGIKPSNDELIDLGIFRYEGHEENERLHREFSHVYMLRDDRALDAFSFNDGEVTALAAIALSRLRSLFAGRESCAARYFDGSTVYNRVLNRNEFHPLLFDDVMKEYMSVIMRAAEELGANKPVNVKMPL